MEILICSMVAALIIIGASVMKVNGELQTLRHQLQDMKRELEKLPKGDAS